MPEEQTPALEEEMTTNEVATDEQTDSSQQESPAMEGSRTYTQEEFDSALESAVQKAKGDVARERVERINKQKKKLASENEELSVQVSDLTAQLEEYKAKEQRETWAKEVADESGIPADVLRGDTLEELKAHAEALKPYFEKPSAPYVSSDGFAANKAAESNVDWLREALTTR